MILTTFKSVERAYVDLKIDLPWTELAELLCEHHDVERKELGPMFNFADFKTLDEEPESARRYHYIDGIKQETFDEIPNTVRRSKANVKSIQGIILDVDKFKTIEEVMASLDGIEYVLYTTFRHTIENHRFRVVIPFSQPLLAEDVIFYKDDIKTVFPGVDNASFTVSQSFYFHSGKNDPIAYHNKGLMIDPYTFKYQEPKVYEEPKHTNLEFSNEEIQAYKQAVVKSLLSCSGLHYASEASQYGVLTLVAICKSIGLTYEEYDSICFKISAGDSSLKQASFRRSAWVGWQGDKVRRETRDAFIQAYNGEPVKVKKQIGISEELKNKYLVKE
jgi:hypothetical protein